ncbi:site-specific integrase [Kitasatospora purpeofusca]|uniref:site-specific integrase n=1 Tax=Kitasatospora purpeofusca TaxID=67352 RepID=UPI0022595634|nr:site-specific integrase [Kitasatospora purpeofusca]MCX4688564.1 site-specific integrase [Kitasatospora purpeofusca]
MEDAGHGSWTYCVDLAPQDGKRKTRRRGGFATRAEAAREMKAVLNGELRGVYEDRRVTVASFLRQWLAAKKEELAPNTYAGYEACVERDLIPAFGHYRLPDLRPKHIERWITAQRKTKRGKVTVYRIVSTLRNALNHAVRAWGLRYNPAKHSVPARPRAAERTCWTPDEAATFLRHGAEYYADQLTDLFEVMLGTGMRRGEVLALHWSDVHLMDRKLYVRWTLAAIDNGTIHLREPKTEASRAWISLSPRVMATLHRQAALQMNANPTGRLEGLVFARPGGTPLRPQWVLDQLRKRTAELELPRIGLHDLRHTAASIMIAESIPIAIVSKTLRHATLATTINLYGHLLKDSADQAVNALARALDRAQSGQLQELPRGGDDMPLAA